MDRNGYSFEQRLRNFQQNSGDEENPMTTKKSFNRIVAVVFVVTLLISSGAQAGSLFRPDGARTVESTPFFEQAATWMLDAWSGLAGLFVFSSETTQPTSQECTNSCGDGDAGPGIDPEG